MRHHIQGGLHTAMGQHTAQPWWLSHSHGALHSTIMMAFTVQPWGIKQHSQDSLHSTAMGHQTAQPRWPSQYSYEASHSTARVTTVQAAMRHHTAQPGWPSQYSQPWVITQHSQGDLHSTANHEASHNTARETFTVQPAMRHHTAQPGWPSQYSHVAILAIHHSCKKILILFIQSQGNTEQGQSWLAPPTKMPFFLLQPNLCHAELIFRIFLMKIFKCIIYQISTLGWHRQ